MPESQTITNTLSETQRHVLDQLLVGHTFRDEQALLEEGRAAEGLFIVDVGRLTVLKKDVGKHQRLITELEAPVVVGELELLTGDVCNATVRARGVVEARLLPAEQFNDLLGKGDAGAIQLMRGLARALGQKLAASNELYVDLAIWR
jgi:CRP-like cAMP-binding protein